MDEDLFIRTEQIVTRPENLQPYLCEYGVGTLDAVVEAMTPERPAHDLQENLMVEGLYAMLLKAALIHYQSQQQKRPLVGKIQELFDWMLTEFRGSIGREFQLSVLIFEGLLRKFAGIQANQDPKSVI